MRKLLMLGILCLLGITGYAQTDLYELSLPEIPGQTRLSALDREGVKIIQYLGGDRYLVQLSEASKARNVQAKPFQAFVAPELLHADLPEWARPAPGMAEIAVQFRQDLLPSKVAAIVASWKGTARFPWKGQPGFIVTVPIDQLQKVVRDPHIIAAEPVHEPPVPLDEPMEQLQRVNILRHRDMALTGKGVTVAIGDGGQLGSHIDFGSRVINQADGTYSSFGSHGDHVSGIVGGGGFIHPSYRGLAPGVRLVTQKTSNAIFQAEMMRDSFGVVLTNNSYGSTPNCATNGVYNYTSQTLDWQMRSFPDLLHVFAAGNSGASTCDTLPRGFRTVLRFYQSAKNVLTVGNVNINREASVSSSRGPVADGRIKPEIVAVGVDVISTGRNYNYYSSSGTSMASPAVVGSLALLVEQYRKTHNGENPRGDLLKALACNTADDIGRPGPDYIYGFGMINARRAERAMTKGQFSLGSIENGQTQRQVIQVPAGVKRVKVMLYWHDKEGTPNTPKALVNDLHLRVNASGETFLPWVLTPTVANIDQPATRRVDTLNNIEQVTFDNPAQGTIEVEISGSRIPVGPQDYVIVWDFQMDETVITFPLGGEHLTPGAKVWVQWDASENNSSAFDLECSMDGGKSWQPVANGLVATERKYEWQVPADFADQCRLRVIQKSTGQVSASEDILIMGALPAPPTFEPACGNGVKLQWPAVQNAREYEILKYDGQELVKVGATQLQEFEMKNQLWVPGDSMWFAIRPVTLSGVASQRSSAQPFAVTYTQACPVAKVDGQLVRFSLRNVGRQYTSSQLGQERFQLLVKNNGVDFLENAQVVVNVNNVVKTFGMELNLEPGASGWYDMPFAINFVKPGKYRVEVTLYADQDTDASNDSQLMEVRHLGNEVIQLPWQMQAEDVSVSEALTGLPSMPQWDFTVQGDGMVQAKGDTMEILLADGPVQERWQNLLVTLNLSQIPGGTPVVLNYDYNSNFGRNTTLWVRGHDTLPWVKVHDLPSTNESWQMRSADITALLTQHQQAWSSSFQLRWESLDEGITRLRQIRLEGLSTSTPPAVPQLNWSLAPNPATTHVQLLLEAPVDGPAEVQLWDLSGQLLRKETLQLAKGENSLHIPVEQYPRGSYLVQVFHKTFMVQRQILLQ